MGTVGSMAKYKGKFENAADVSEVTQDSAAVKATKANKKKSKKKMSTPVKIILIVLALVVILAGTVLGYANHMLGKIDRSKNTGDQTLSYADLLEDGEYDSSIADSTEELAKIQENYDAIKDLPLLESSDTITNYLIIGCDSRDGTNTGRSDSMIVMTVNRETQKIHLTSLMRQIYVIMPEGSGHTDGMLNWAYAWGGADLLIETIENNFKIGIDHYVTINFESFETIIDTIGGVSIELSEAEANYVSKRTNSNLTAGVQLLDGEQALVYARCRKLDNDFIRTNRQRNVVEAVVKSMNGISVTQLNNLANVLLPAVSTDMTNTQILSEIVYVPTYATYPIDQLMLPIENMEGMSYTGRVYKYGAEMYSVDWNTNLPAISEFINS